jgi:head-tail adaptor
MPPPSNGSLTGPASSKWVVVPIAMATECPGSSAAQSSANMRDDLQLFANRRQSRIGAEIRMAFDGRIGVVSQQRRPRLTRERLDGLMSHGALYR